MKMDENPMISAIEEKCEYLMNIVVESRKQFGKMCVDYNQKTSLVENKILKLHLKNISMSRFKAKSIPAMNIDGMKNDLDEFVNEILVSQRREEELGQNIRNTQSIVMQLKNDAIGHKLRTKITAETLLAEAKRKNNK